MEAKMPVKVLLVDDHQIVRDGIIKLLGGRDDIKIVGEASNGKEAIDFCDRETPDVILMDIAMPDMNGIEASHQILKKHSRCRIIILSMHADKLFVSRAFAAGVSGYLLKDCDIDEIIEAIQSVASNQTYVSPLVAGTVVEGFRESIKNMPTDEAEVLTDREREVLQLIAEGKTSKEIASSLDLSTKTIDAHRQQIMDKLNIHSIAGLTRYALKHGIIS